LDIVRCLQLFSTTIKHWFSSFHCRRASHVKRVDHAFTRPHVMAAGSDKADVDLYTTRESKSPENTGLAIEMNLMCNTTPPIRSIRLSISLSTSYTTPPLSLSIRSIRLSISLSTSYTTPPLSLSPSLYVLYDSPSLSLYVPYDSSSLPLYTFYTTLHLSLRSIRLSLSPSLYVLYDSPSLSLYVVYDSPSLYVSR
jgi:hypothetical protein